MLLLLVPTLAGLGFIAAKNLKTNDGLLSLTLLKGVLLCTAVWAVVAFVYPLNLTVEIITIFVGLAAFLYGKVYQIFWQSWIKFSKSFWFFLVLIVAVGSYFPFILDHFGYYVPTVKWLSEIGLVKGISNLDLLLGQMSFWHIFQAGFSNFGDPFLRINVLALVIYLFYIYERRVWIHLFFLPVLFLFLQSPSPDLPVNAFALIILNEVFLKSRNATFLFTTAVFIFVIKPTMIWVPIFVFGYLFLILKSKTKSLFLGGILLIIYCFKNLWTFGFPIFPAQFVDFNIPWKPNPKLLQNSAEMAIRKTYDLQYTYAEIQQFSFWEYCKNWFLLPGIKGVIHWGYVGFIGVLVYYSVKKNKTLLFLLVIAVLIKSVLVILFSAQYRFFFEIFFVVFFVLFNDKISERTAKHVSIILAVPAVLFLTFPKLLQQVAPSFRLGNYMIGLNKDQWLQPAYYELINYSTGQIGNLKFNKVETYPFSFDTPLPAISPQFIQEDIDAGIFPQYKGKTVREGFIWRPISEKEKMYLKQILKER